MIEITFGWDEEAHRITRDPESPRATREEGMAYAKHVQAMRGPAGRERDIGSYRMAELAYELREYYQPCETIPGLRQPIWLVNSGPGEFSEVRDGLRVLRGVTGDPAALEKALDNATPGLSKAVDFQRWVERVTAVEGYNAKNASVLLMAHATLHRLNPEGDAPRVELLRALMARWFRIDRPSLNAHDRGQQASHHAKRRDWLTPAWRDLWATP